MISRVVFIRIDISQNNKIKRGISYLNFNELFDNDLNTGIYNY